MAINYFYEFTPNTAEYIDSLNDTQRIGHHNYVIEQKYCNTSPAVVHKSPEELKKFDGDCLEYLKYLDA